MRDSADWGACLWINVSLILALIMSCQDTSKDDLKKRLTPEQYRITQECGTERPFDNAYWNYKEAGIYVDIVSGEPLFSSLEKYDSGSGWPSFTKPIDKEHIQERPDTSHGMTRTEIRSSKAGSHLGHVFPDGPGPEGLRYCVNSASLRFIPVSKLDVEGYGEFKKLFSKEDETRSEASKELARATLAGGCFWGIEELIRSLPGVVETTVGYTGGDLKNPTYEDVKTGKTGHAEAVQILFDPKKISYEEVLRFFFRLHDPTTLNRQGNDRGTQYRSAIFVHNDEQRKIAERIRKEVDESKKWSSKVVTTIEEAKTFYSAESYHQDYLQKNSGGYTCHYLRD